MGILSSLGLWPGSRAPLDDALRHVIDHAIETVDPMLKTVVGHERVLAPAVSHALGYCEALAAAIPCPVEVSSRAFSADPLVHALFATPGDIGDMLGKSRELRAFLADPAQRDNDEFFGLLGMRRGEKAVMGAVLNGDRVQNEVLQHQLYFADHTLGGIAFDCETTRERFQSTAFDGLVLGFADSVAELRRQRQEASTAWRMEQAAGGDNAGRLRELEERQRQATAALVPKQLLAAFAEWLAAPEGRLYLKPTEVTVDRMGVMASPATADDKFRTLNLPELVCRDRRHWIVVVARISREEALEAVRRQQEGNRYLMI